MPEHLLEVKIIQPGRVAGQYYAVDSDTLRLDKIIYPDEILPFDVGILPTALTPFDEPFTVLIQGGFSHPINTEIESRLLGALQRNSEIPILLAVPTADEHAPQCLNGLAVKQRAEIIRILNHSGSSEWHWLTVENVESHLHTAALRYRQKQANGYHRGVDPAWKPLYIGRPAPNFAEADRYTPAEYTFYELPYHFQHYVSEHLAPDERVLCVARRPAMPSQRKLSWLRREYLQAGALILTSQRLIHLSELIPPDNANIRYGYHTTVGVLERFAGATLQNIGKEGLLLCSEWLSKDGKKTIEWETPVYTRSVLDELMAFLQAFQVEDPSACILRRATPPAPPEPLPPLRDSAANNPQTLIPINERFSAALNSALASGEQVHAWAFTPEWFTPQKTSQALVVTECRLFTLPEVSLDIPLAQIATLEYTGSILESSIAVNYFDKGNPRRVVVPFPYPAEAAFRDCFEATRRCMAVVPLA